MNSLWWIGSAGIMAIEASYVPQVLRLHRLKHANDMSYLFPTLNILGRVLALSYAVANHDRVFIGGFIVGIVLRAILLAQVVWYRRIAPSFGESLREPAVR